MPAGTPFWLKSSSPLNSPDSAPVCAGSRGVNSHACPQCITSPAPFTPTVERVIATAHQIAAVPDPEDEDEDEDAEAEADAA